MLHKKYLLVLKSLLSAAGLPSEQEVALDSMESNLSFSQGKTED